MTDPETTETTPGRTGRIPGDTFSNRLLLTRALAGHISIREACEMTGLNRGSWQGWERGLRPRDILDVAQRISEALDVDREWLLWGGPLAGPRGVRVADQVTERPGEATVTYPQVGRSGHMSISHGRPGSVAGIPSPRRPVRISQAVAA